MFSAYDTNEDSHLSWDEWQVYVQNESINHQERGDNFWMEQHMNFNYVDSNCNNLIEFEEYESFIEEIG